MECGVYGAGKNEKAQKQAAICVWNVKVELWKKKKSWMG